MLSFHPSFTSWHLAWHGMSHWWAQVLEINARLYIHLFSSMKSVAYWKVVFIVWSTLFFIYFFWLIFINVTYFKIFIGVHAYVLSCVWLFVTLWTVSRKAPLFMGFPGQEYWRGLPFPSPGDLTNPRIEPESLMSPALASGFFTTSANWEAWYLL